MSRPNKAADKAGPRHWQTIWQESTLPRLVTPSDSSVRNHVRRCLHGFFSRAINGRRGLKLIEVGCANSVWLPYFAEEHGCLVSGVDSSRLGCESARKLLTLAGVSGDILEADLWDIPEALIGSFDVVFTYGFVEHFEPVDGVLVAASDLLKPGGLIVTIVPNLSGLNGLLQKYLNRSVFDIHVAMDLDDLDAAHKKADLEVSWSGYLCSINFGVINPAEISDGFLTRAAKSVFVNALIGLSALVWWLEDHHVLRVRPNRLTSPYIACMATKGKDIARQPSE